MHLGWRVLAADEELHAVPLRHLPHELTKVAAPFEGGEDAAQASAVRELGRLHDVEQTVAVHLLHRRIVDLGEEAAGALEDGSHDRSVRERLGEARGGSGKLRLIGQSLAERSLLLPGGERIVLAIPIEDVILNGIRRVRDWSRIWKGIGASVEAVFTVQENDAGSLILRWEVGTLAPGENALVRFQAKVR